MFRLFGLLLVGLIYGVGIATQSFASQFESEIVKFHGKYGFSKYAEIKFTDEGLSEPIIFLHSSTGDTPVKAMLVLKSDTCTTSLHHDDGAGSSHFKCSSGLELRAKYQCSRASCLLRGDHHQRGRWSLLFRYHNENIALAEMLRFYHGQDAQVDSQPTTNGTTPIVSSLTAQPNTSSPVEKDNNSAGVPKDFTIECKQIDCLASRGQVRPCRKKTEEKYSAQITYSNSEFNFRTIQNFESISFPAISYSEVPKSSSIHVNFPKAFIEENYKFRLWSNGRAILNILNPTVSDSYDMKKKILRYKCALKADELKIALREQENISEKPSSVNVASQKETERLREELAALKTQQEQQQQTISNDTQIPLITAMSRWDSQTNAVISGQVTDNVAVAELAIDGEPVSLGNDGLFTISLYVPRSGKTVEIVAFDKKGNKATKSLFIERGEVQQATGPVFASLNPSGKRVKSNKDALALIIGVADYQRTPAKAAFADKDAQTFYDYAMLKLGIPAGNIKELVNTDANEAELRLAVKDWIARSTKQGQSDIYIFFAGHGLASEDGEKMYLLPADGEPRLLDDTAILRDELFADISAANPRSVTVFLDTCYSGTTRGTDMLIASRPIAIRALKQSIPDNFTVMTAAAGDQTAKPLEEAKHGMFSYFLMKGMEGEADANNDNEITAGELHSYVQTNVIQQSSGSQTPELQGDSDRVLVRFQ